MVPLLMLPAFKDYLWGGDRLITEYHKACPFPVAAESWEVSCRPEGLSLIGNGPLAGRTLAELVQGDPSRVLGTRAGAKRELPMLIKLIDAKESLSIQVHPTDEYARSTGCGCGKTEVWAVLDCDPGAFIYYGLERAVSRDDLARLISDGTLPQALRRVAVDKGDVFFVEAGTLHAIGAGILIAEVQQNSDTTYRVCDYGRVGADGKPRRLHIDAALEVASLTPCARTPARIGTAPEQLLAGCEHFKLYSHSVGARGLTLDTQGESFHALLCLDGTLTVAADGAAVSLAPGQSAFITADTRRYTLSGPARTLRAGL